MKALDTFEGALSSSASPTPPAAAQMHPSSLGFIHPLHSPSTSAPSDDPDHSVDHLIIDGFPPLPRSMDRRIGPTTPAHAPPERQSYAEIVLSGSDSSPDAADFGGR